MVHTNVSVWSPPAGMWEDIQSEAAGLVYQ